MPCSQYKSVKRADLTKKKKKKKKKKRCNISYYAFMKDKVISILFNLQ